MHRMCQSLLIATFVVALSGLVEAQSIQPPQTDKRVEIVAEGMCCKGCARDISGQLYAAKGVKSVEIDMDRHVVSVSLSPDKKTATLGQLWDAVEQHEGDPVKLVTAEATYTLTPPKDFTAAGNSPVAANSSISIVVDNLHCMGCAKKIGAQLYALKGVTKVHADLQRDTLTVETRSKTPISPWQAIAAVMKAKEFPLAVTGSHGTLSIEWVAKRKPKNHKHAHQTTIGGIQR